MKESRQSREDSEGKFTELTERYKRLTRTNDIQEKMMEEVTLLMKKARTEKREKEGEADKEISETETKDLTQVNEEKETADNSKIDPNLSNISDRIELFAGKSFDEDMGQLDSGDKKRKDGDKESKKVVETQRENSNSRGDQKKSKKRDEKEDHHRSSRDRDRSCSTRDRKRKHHGDSKSRHSPGYKEENSRQKRSRDSHSNSDFTKIKTSDGKTEQRIIRYI